MGEETEKEEGFSRMRLKEGQFPHVKPIYEDLQTLSVIAIIYKLLSFISS